MTTTTTKYGMFGIAAIVAILSVSLIAFAPMAQEAKANAANKNGFASSTVEMMWSEADGAGNILPMEIAYYDFKTSNDNDWLVDFTAECGTANHIKAAGKKGNDKSTDETSVSTKIFFVVEHPDKTMWLVNIDGEKQQYLQEEGVSNADTVYHTDIPEVAMWNLCSQQFDIQVNLNSLISSCGELDAAGEIDDENDLAECLIDTTGDGVGDTVDENKLVYTCLVDEDAEECEQSVELFLSNSGTRSAKAVLMDLPHGDNEIYVFGMMAADGSTGEFLSLNGGEDGTSTWIGKRILTVDTFHTDQSEIVQ